MALIKCEECSKEISSKAKICLHCGAKLPSIVPTLVWGGLIICILIAVIVQLCTNIFFDKPKVTLNKQGVVKMKESVGMVKKLIDNGFVKKVTPELNKAYVDDYLWVSMSALKKRAMGRALAYYCGYKKGSGLFWVDIYMWQSGKKVAKYSESQGFRVY